MCLLYYTFHCCFGGYSTCKEESLQRIILRDISASLKHCLSLDGIPHSSGVNGLCDVGLSEPCEVHTVMKPAMPFFEHMSVTK